MSKSTLKKQVSVQVVLAATKRRASAPIKRIKAIKKITSNEKNIIVADSLKQLKEIRKETERQYDEIVGPMELSLRRVKELFKPTFLLFDEIEQQGKANIKQFMLESHEKQKKLDEQYAKGKIRKGITLMKKRDELEVDLGSVTSRTIKKLVCVSAKKTPREYLVPDESAIRKALLQGKVVTGWKLIEDKSLAI